MSQREVTPAFQCRLQVVVLAAEEGPCLFEVCARDVARSSVDLAFRCCSADIERKRREQSAIASRLRVEAQGDQRGSERGIRQCFGDDAVVLVLIRIREGKVGRGEALRIRTGARERPLDGEASALRVQHIGRLVVVPRLPGRGEPVPRRREGRLLEGGADASIERRVPSGELHRPRATEEVDVSPVDLRARLLFAAVADAEVHLAVFSFGDGYAYRNLRGLWSQHFS